MILKLANNRYVALEIQPGKKPILSQLARGERDEDAIARMVAPRQLTGG
jgi:hypothetical protein